MLYGESAPLPATPGRHPNIVRGFVRVAEKQLLTARHELAIRDRSESQD
jgi:hypothetical protein